MDAEDTRFAEDARFARYGHFLTLATAFLSGFSVAAVAAGLVLGAGQWTLMGWALSAVVGMVGAQGVQRAALGVEVARAKRMGWQQGFDEAAAVALAEPPAVKKDEDE